MTWVYENADVVTAIANSGVFLIYATYLHLFYRGYQRQNRTRIVIDQMSGQGAESTCSIANMSKEWIYLECIFVAARTEDAEYAARVTEIHSVSSVLQGDHAIASLVRQGPLAPGKMLTVGTLEELFLLTVQGIADSENVSDGLHAIEIRVVATVSSEDQPIGARRRFLISTDEGGRRFRPEQQGTKQMLSRSEARQVMSWLDDVTTVA